MVQFPFVIQISLSSDTLFQSIMIIICDIGSLQDQQICSRAYIPKAGDTSVRNNLMSKSHVDYNSMLFLYAKQSFLSSFLNLDLSALSTVSSLFD